MLDNINTSGLLVSFIVRLALPIHQESGETIRNLHFPLYNPRPFHWCNYFLSFLRFLEDSGRRPRLAAGRSEPTLSFAFSKCGLHRPNTRRRKTKPRHARGARQGGHAADVKLLKAVVTLLHPLMTVRQDTEEEKWHFAAWHSNH